MRGVHRDRVGLPRQHRPRRRDRGRQFAGQGRAPPGQRLQTIGCDPQPGPGAASHFHARDASGASGGRTSPRSHGVGALTCGGRRRRMGRWSGVALDHRGGVTRPRLGGRGRRHGRRRARHLGRHRRPAGPTPAGLRPRRTDDVRARRGDRAVRDTPRQHPGRAHRHRDRQHRMAQMGDRDGRRPGRPRRAGRRRTQRPAHPAAAGPRRLRGHAQIRLRRRAAGAGAGQRPRDRRPGRGGHGRTGIPEAGAGCRGALHVISIGASAPYEGRRRGPRTYPPSTPARYAPTTRPPRRT